MRIPKRRLLAAIVQMGDNVDGTREKAATKMSKEGNGGEKTRGGMLSVLILTHWGSLQHGLQCS